MTMTKINKIQARENIKYEVAKQIRQLLDESRKQYGPQDWDDDDIESAVCELVFEEDS